MHPLIQKQRDLVQSFHLYATTYKDALDAAQRQHDSDKSAADNRLSQALQSSQATFNSAKGSADNQLNQSLQSSQATLSSEKQRAASAKASQESAVYQPKNRADIAISQVRTASAQSARSGWGAGVRPNAQSAPPLAVNGVQVTRQVQDSATRIEDDAAAIRDYLGKNPSNGAGAFTVGGLFIAGALLLFATGAGGNGGGSAELLTAALVLIAGGIGIFIGVFQNGQSGRMESRFADALTSAALLENWYKNVMAVVNNDYQKTVSQSEQAHRQRESQAQAAHQSQVTAADQAQRQRESQARATHQQDVQGIDAKLQQDFKTINAQLDQQLNALGPQKKAFEQEAAILGAPWNNALWQNWTPRIDTLPASAATLDDQQRAALQQRVDTWQSWTHGDSVTVTRLGTLTTGFTMPAPFSSAKMALPAFVALPSSNVMIRTNGTGNAPAIQAVQAMILRLLTTQRPRRVILTLIDPIGLGQNVAGFISLKEKDRELISSQAWSDPKDIKDQLLALNAHMETMFQDNLRNQFTSIEEYNAQQGDMGEAYHILVVLDFPTKFADEALGRLESIMTQGPKVGVCTIMMRDTSKQLPHGLMMDAMERSCATILDWNGQRFVWTKSDSKGSNLYQNDQLDLDGPPAQDDVDRYLAAVGDEAAKYQVTIPFTTIAPPASEWWKGDTLGGIKVPIGLAGAQKKQYVELVSNGSNVHALVGGLTGSGKTITLHDLILNAALTYSPKELEMYLIDLNQVGFAPYGTHKLPHARVISMQSGREFGLSVLEALVSEMQHRENLFIGLDEPDEDVLAQQVVSSTGLFDPTADLEQDNARETYKDIEDYRRKNPGRMLPRIMLVVDEFQEFFREEDKIAQQAIIMLDMLAKLGRKFGIHVVLSTQTFMGRFAAPKGTLNQMEVRIVMRSSEDDSNFLLANDPAASRIQVSRKGMGYYNPLGGIKGSSSQFQSANLFVPDELDTYLDALTQMAETHPDEVPPGVRIVFDGNAEANISENRRLNELLEYGFWPATPPNEAIAFLGEPLAIRVSTAVNFIQERGSNLLVVGARRERELSVGLNMLVTTLLSLGCQYAPHQVQFTILDFTRVGAANAETLKQLVEELRPKYTINLSRKESDIAPLYAELGRRLEGAAPQDVRHFLFVFGLHNASDLQNENRGWGNQDGPKTPAEQFAELLKSGPEVGMFTFAWCDTGANAESVLGRSGLATFKQRVVFTQQSPDESQTLLADGSAAPGKLSERRAILFNAGRKDEFRPYSLQSLQHWLPRAIGQLLHKDVMTSA